MARAGGREPCDSTDGKSDVLQIGTQQPGYRILSKYPARVWKQRCLEYQE
jgi:hypothetical protein